MLGTVIKPNSIADYDRPHSSECIWPLWEVWRERENVCICLTI